VKKTCAQRETLAIAGFALDGNDWDGIYVGRRKGKDLVYAGKVDGFDKVSAGDLRKRLRYLEVRYLEGWEARWKKPKEAPMIDAAYSRQKLQVDHAAVRARRRLIIPLVAAFVLIGGGWMTVWALSASKEVAPRTLDELLETTKGLEVTQQQAVDQLQIVQDQLVAQRTETKKLSEQIATLTERLDALQQSVANIPAPSVAAPVTLPKAQPSKR
jgi:hypothetical protein